MTVNIFNTPIGHVGEIKNIEEEKVPTISCGSLDLFSCMILVGYRVFNAGMGVVRTVGHITTKEEPRSPHMIIFDSIEGRL